MVDVLEILLVDDSATDAKLVRHFAMMARVQNPIHHIDSGEKALAYLETARPLPGLILLDLNMPVMDGHEVLQAIRDHSDPAIARLPVVILTTSDHPGEIAKAYDGRANSYLVKPQDAAGFQRMLEALSAYWFDVVRTAPDG
jgi:CheY-like chemotaxis protein